MKEKYRLDFLVIGAAKCGTTTLHDVLVQHPQIFVPAQKDFRFFDNTDNYSKGMSWYESYFTGSKNFQIKGEVSATYLYSREAILRIKNNLNSDIKLIILIRDPAQRAYSEYQHQKRALKLNGTFDEYLNPEFKGPYKTPLHPFEMLIGRGLYATHIKNWLEHFKKENILVLTLEELKANQEAFLDKLFSFLEVDFYNVHLDEAKNKAYTPKNVILQRVLHNRFIRKITRNAIPSFTIREKLRHFIIRINSSRRGTPSLPKDSYKLLYDKYFYDEISEMKGLFANINYNEKIR